MISRVVVKSPATIANLGPGFDVVAAAIEGLYDVVEVSVLPGGGEVIVESRGFNVPSGRYNVAYHVAKHFIERYLEKRSVDIHIVVNKGVPPACGLGSSGATSAAVAFALSVLFKDVHLSVRELLELARVGEAFVAGSPHYDNVAASLFGGFIILDLLNLKVYRYTPRRAIPVGIVIPRLPHTSEFRKTAYARSILPAEVALEAHVKQASTLAKLIYAILTEDLRLLGEAVSTDLIVEPHRSKLIPYYHELKQLALSEGAYGFNICGAGPAVFLIHEDPAKLRAIVEKLRLTLQLKGVEAEALTTFISSRGVDVIEVVQKA